jgi:iron complex outermembrane receptor protein
LDWAPQRAWNAALQLNRVEGRQREPGDLRPPVKDYTTADLTLRYSLANSPWELSLTVRNLFNADAREPSPYGVPFVSIPNDLPLPGRGVFLRLATRI